MDRSPASFGWLCLLLTLLVSSASQAQGNWNPERYTELAQEGQRLFDEAIAIPETRIAARQRIFYEANSYLKEALAMIRLAFETGAVDDEHRAALGDFFTLTENLIVVWTFLDACWPAERLWNVATHHPGLSSSRQRELFDPLLVQLQECRDRKPLFDWTEYQTLVQEAESAWSSAPTAPDPLQSLIEATRANREALMMLQPAVFDGALLDSPIESPPSELLARHRMMFDLLVALGQCEEAADQVTDAQRDAVVLLQMDATEIERWRTELDACGPVAFAITEETVAEETVAEEPYDWDYCDDYDDCDWEDADAVEQVSEEEEDIDTGPEPVLSVREGVGYALVGATAILVASVFILDATSKSDRDELEQLQQECAVGPCDTYRAEQLADDIDSTKVMVGVMIGGAVVTGTVALVLLLTGRDEEPPSNQASVVPFFGSDGFGAAVHFNY